ncbi:MAG: Maf family protein, partial [Chloroflexota bacterium]
MPATPELGAFILASASPRRKELLELLGIPFTVVLPESPAENAAARYEASSAGIDETPLPGEAPPDLVQRLSRAKALAVARQLPPP